MAAFRIFKPRGRKPNPACKCNSGEYCAVHQIYSTRTINVKDDPREQEDPSSFQQCGGGRRIMRKRIGGD